LFLKHILSTRATFVFVWVHIVSHIVYLDGKAYRGNALIIRSSIRHYGIGKYQKEFLQTISAMETEMHILLFRIFTTVIKSE